MGIKEFVVVAIVGVGFFSLVIGIARLLGGG